MKRTNKLWLTLLLALLVAALVAVGLTAAAEDAPTVVASGYCGGEGDGTNIVWVLTNDGTLTISGTGAMKSYLDEMPPWYDYADLIRCVILEDGVTTVGDAAFVGCANLIEATMPDSVERVGMGAFSGCQSLKSIDLSHVTKICHLAFAGCAALNSVNLTVCTDIEDTGFTDCTALSQLFLSEPMNLGPYAFYGCPLTDIFYTGSEAQWAQDIADKFNPYYPVTSVPFESIRIHYNVVDWGYCGDDDDGTNIVWVLTNDGTLTFSGTGAMKIDVVHEGTPRWLDYSDLIRCGMIEDGVKTIGEAAFYGCSNLSEVTLPDSVEKIDMYAFWGCQSLKSIDLSHVTDICHYAFIDCAALKSVTLTKCSFIADAFMDCTSLSKLFLSEQIRTIYVDAFYNCPLTDIFFTGSEVQWAQGIGGAFDPSTGVITVPADSIRIHYNVVDWGYCGGDLIWTLDSEGTLTISGTGGMRGYDAYWQEDGYFSTAPWWNYRDSIQTLMVEDGVTSIGSCAFAGCNSLTKATIPEGVTTMGNTAFRSCSSLKTVVLPASLTRVQEWAFSECDAITDVFYGGNDSQWYDIMYYDPGLNTDVSLANSVYGVGSLPNANIHYNAAWHTPGAPVRENEVAATCTTAGSYDEVIYCTQCDYAFSRTLVTVDPTGHLHTEQRGEVQPPRNGHGHEAGLFCTDCNDWVTGNVIHNQNGPRENEIPATVDAPGSVEIQCTACGEWGLYEIPQLEPDDSGETNPPTQPEQPEQPGGFFRNLAERARQLANGFIQVLLRLIRWLGGKK